MSDGPFLTVGEFAERVALLCRQYGGSVTSWVRSPRRNVAVEGEARSFHLQGLGADVVLDDSANEDSFIIRAKRCGLEVIKEGDHLHVEVGI